MKNSTCPLVSVIIPTFNNESTIERCLVSVAAQRYKNFEIIIIDNYSSDRTSEIALEFTKNLYFHGSERCEQANFGVSNAVGQYILRLDADFVLDENVIGECIDLASEGFDAIEIHTSPDPTISWLARARRFEYDLLKGDPNRVSARFVKKDLYLEVGGLNVELIAGEDFDFQNKLNRLGVSLGFIDSEMLHLGEPKSLLAMIRKYFRYGRQSVKFKEISEQMVKGQLDATSVFQKLYLPKKIKVYVQSPKAASQFIFYFFIKVFVGALGYLFEKSKNFIKSKTNFVP